jgi:raffinose/stachyose/melibiose transport system permease protein
MKNKSRFIRLKKNNIISGWIMLLPAIFFIVAFLYYPLIESLRLSFFRWNGLSPEIFIRLKNYIELFTRDRVFIQTVKNTLIFSGLSVTGIVGIGFFLALIIERRVKGWTFYKVVWFLPVIMSQTIVGVLWTRFYEPDSGLVNIILTKLGLERLTQIWLGNPDIALYSVVAVNIWQYSGYAMLLLLVALENIDMHVQEAATIDGVNIYQRVRYIMLPLIRPVFIIVVMLMLIGTLKSFDSIFVLTGGGPGNSTMVLSVALYNNAFSFYRLGYGSAIAVFMFVLLFTISILYQRIFMRND